MGVALHPPNPHVASRPPRRPAHSWGLTARGLSTTTTDDVGDNRLGSLARSVGGSLPSVVYWIVLALHILYLIYNPRSGNQTFRSMTPHLILATRPLANVDTLLTTALGKSGSPSRHALVSVRLWQRDTAIASTTTLLSHKLSAIGEAIVYPDISPLLIKVLYVLKLGCPRVLICLGYHRFVRRRPHCYGTSGVAPSCGDPA